MINCKNCIRFKNCKFIDKNKEFAKQMNSMFKYAESNNLEELFYKNAGSCNFFIGNEMNVDDLLKKINTAKYQIDWIHSYVKTSTDASFTVEKLVKITDDYKKALEK